MSKPAPVYDASLIHELRTLVADCPTWLEARDKLARRLGIHHDNVTKMNKRHGFWGIEEIRGKGPTVKVWKPGRKLRRLFWDIETSPNVVLSWRVGYKINLDHSNILKERAVICIGFKWEGESKVHVLHWDENQDDKKMLTEFLEVANEADELVAHNGDRFDLAWFKTRCLFHGLTTLPAYKTIDTLKIARRKFYFNSNRLDYIAKFLGLGGKIKTEFGLWKDIVLKQCPRSLKLMLDYCKKDVALLEQVWARLVKMTPHQTHAGVLGGGEKWSCVHDGSTNVRLNKVSVTAVGTTKYQMKCQDCGGHYTISQRIYDDFLAAKR